MGLFANTGVIACLLVGVAAPAFCQSAGNSDATPKFELADIHPSPAAAPGNGNQFMRGGFYRGGRYEVHNASLVDLIRTAYGLDSPDKVTGGPDWLDKDRFDIVAKAPVNATPENLRLMLQGLLADRFKLAVHNDTKPLPAYALRAGKSIKMKLADGTEESGCKLQPQPEPAPTTGPRVMIGNINGTTLVFGAGAFLVYNCHNVTMASMPDELLKMILSRQYLTNSRIVDETGLKGAWNFDLKYSLKLGMMATSQDTDTITLFDAIDKQLGLRLEPAKSPFSVVVVDSVNEKPTDNLPGVTEKLPAPPTEFEVAVIKPSDPNARQGGFRTLFGAGGRVNLPDFTMQNLIGMAWNLPGNAADLIVGLPKSLGAARWDIIAKAPEMQPVNPNINVNNPPPPPQVDYATVQTMLQALLKDRFNLKLHEEQRPLPGYALIAVKPKLKPAEPGNREGCSEGPGANGKDPRTTNPGASRLVTCLNITMAEFVTELANRANGYFFQFPGGIVDQTKLDGKYDITLNFSGAGVFNGGGGRGGGEIGSGAGGPSGTGDAVDPGGAISVQEAVEKQLGLKLIPQKNPAKVLVIDHIDEKPSDN